MYPFRYTEDEISIVSSAPYRMPTMPHWKNPEVPRYYKRTWELTLSTSEIVYGCSECGRTAYHAFPIQAHMGQHSPKHYGTPEAFAAHQAQCKRAQEEAVPVAVIEAREAGVEEEAAFELNWQRTLEEAEIKIEPFLDEVDTSEILSVLSEFGQVKRCNEELELEVKNLTAALTLYQDQWQIVLDAVRANRV